MKGTLTTELIKPTIQLGRTCQLKLPEMRSDVGRPLEQRYPVGAAAAAKSLVMSDSVWPHRRQPTRLCSPWDSPGKNTGVGCYFLLQCMKVKSESEVAQSCLTLAHPMDCSPPGSSIHGIFQAKVLEWGAIFWKELITHLNIEQFISNKHLFIAISPVIYRSLH